MDESRDAIKGQIYLRKPLTLVVRQSTLQSVRRIALRETSKVTVEANPGWAAGIGQSNRVKKIGWALKGAPRRKMDLRLSALSGIAEARKLRDKVTALMQQADANPEDAMVFCVFAEPDLSALVREIAFLPVGSAVSDIALVSKYPDKLPIGFLVFVLDRSDAQEPIFGHARPLIVQDPRALAMNEFALHSYTQTIKQKYGLVPNN